ncbi:MAG TPA: helicase-related protein, partial [Dehalococcoidia bacterium]|nr:helicase-related protein [Dehalococcoidia bacterium]
RARARIAASNPAKLAAVRRILAAHPEATALIIGQYLDQLAGLAEALEAPLVTGRTDTRSREAVYAGLGSGAIRRAVLSRVANQAIDLPAADLAIEVSGCFGSRQEEAQRLGRILRPKGGRTAHFYTIVSAGTVEEDYAARRQRFLLERGYRFRIDE